MKNAHSFETRLSAIMAQLGPSELRVAQFIRDNREEALMSSASALAARTTTSDATVIRAMKAMGYASMAELRQELAGELRYDLSLASRLVRTLDEVEEVSGGSLEVALRAHQQALARLSRDIAPALFETVVARIVAAPRVFIFGIGPSSAMANYFAMQLGRFGIDAHTLTDTGLLLADGLHRLKVADLLIMLAFGRPYPEISALVEHAEKLDLKTILITDTLGSSLNRRVDHVLPVQRGRADALSLHTATLGLLEAMLVGVATKCPTDTIASLKRLNSLRRRIAGQPMSLPSPNDGGSQTARTKRRSIL